MQWIAMTWTRYHTEICLILRYLQRVTINFFKKIVYMFFINLTVTRGNPLQIAQDQANLRENVR